MSFCTCGRLNTEPQNPGHSPLGPGHAPLYSNGDFTAVIKAMILKWKDYPGSEWTPYVITSVLIRERFKNR